MTHNENDAPSTERKKISLQEAMKQKIASKNQGVDFGKPSSNTIKGNNNVPSQQSKKRTIQRSRKGL
ncbi:hypothetical protein [Alkaliphilus peptidifermentans]|uniref:Uncharacterized protein n=1 Tax=Alkaliphilus peptidifermentans DSM 18978 TaxID=1120976 RepID=A0A1G5L2C4_9FIRM|nr:hypothetical protein [Alkaliphilus peptidifermentans]SCZ06339.1 hypothetical protein SAMN03080606_03938 [Alkaliphilus peptidifermentans DSM 18978]